MKKIFLLIAVAVFATAASAKPSKKQDRTEPVTTTQTQKDTIYYSSDKILQEYKVEVRTIKGPEDVNVKVFSKTYLHPSKTIEAAIKERLAKEGLSTKKKDNGFFGCMGVKYNPLWDRTFDFYINVVGSDNAGTVNLLVSTGYDNYLDETNMTACLNAAKWLYNLDYDIRMYIYTDNLTNEGENLEDLEKDLDKLKKKKSNLEKQISKNDDQIRKFEAQRIKVTENNYSTIDTKQLDKEKKQDSKLQDKKNSLSYDLNEVQLEIERTELKISQQKEVINKLRSQQPVK